MATVERPAETEAHKEAQGKEGWLAMRGAEAGKVLADNLNGVTFGEKPEFPFHGSLMRPHRQTGGF